MRLKVKIIVFTLLCSCLTFSQVKVNDIARSGCAEDMESFIKEFPEAINYEDSRGFVPLTLACYSGNVEVVKVLVKHVKDIDAVSNYGTPLMAASFKGYKEIVEILLKNGADVNATDSNEVSALHYVVKFTNREIMKLLVDNGADIYKKDKKGFSPLYYAERDNDEEILKILKKEKL